MQIDKVFFIKSQLFDEPVNIFDKRFNINDEWGRTGVEKIKKKRKPQQNSRKDSGKL